MPVSVSEDSEAEVSSVFVRNSEVQNLEFHPAPSGLSLRLDGDRLVGVGTNSEDRSAVSADVGADLVRRVADTESRLSRAVDSDFRHPHLGIPRDLEVRHLRLAGLAILTDWGRVSLILDFGVESHRAGADGRPKRPGFLRNGPSEVH